MDTKKLIGWVAGFLIVAPALGQTQTALAPGKAVYETNCLACHQIDGSGVPQLTPSLIKSKYVAGDKAKLITIVLKGLQDTEIDGQMYDNPMPPFEHLSDEEIANLLTYVRSSFGNSAGPVKTADVVKTRKTAQTK